MRVINATDLIGILDENDVIKLLRELGSEDFRTFSEGYVFRSVCHDSDSYKLHYYSDSKKFFCFRCGKQMSVYDLIMKVNGCDFKDAHKFLKSVVNSYNKTITGFGVNTYKNVSLDDIVIESLPEIDKKYLYKMFKNEYVKEWLEEDISEKAMQKFNIRYDFIKNRAIIPHMNDKGECVGIRVRNFNPIDLSKAKYIPLWHDNKCYSHPLSSNLYGLNISKEKIKRCKKVIIVESEKSVLKYESMYPDNNISVAICGSSFSNTHKKMLINYGIEECIIALDRQYITEDSEEAIQWKKKIYKMAENLLPYCKVSYIWDTDENRLLDYKASPLDAGKVAFEKLVRSRKVII